MKWIFLLSILVVVVAFLFVRRGTNNVCKTFKDYYSNRDNNENCYFNPDHELDPPDIIKRHGYPVEIHKVTTEDGYILTMFRIPHGKNHSTKKKLGKPVLVQHGVTLNGGAFVTIGKKSFAFVLADAGYDVWLGNFRGSQYSRNHTHFDEKNSEFWNFSFHELGVYDLPAEINHIYEVTKQKIFYIGFSMGSAASYIYGVMYPEVSQKRIETIISIAPIAFMENIRIFEYISHLWPIVRDALQFLTNGKLLPRPPLPPTLFKLLCLPFPIQMEICQFPDMILYGYNYQQNDPETLPVTLQYNKDATSVKIISHFTHLMTSGNFLHFDYGIEKNKELYGSEKPPHYDVSKINIPTYLIRAPNDMLSTKENVERLQKALAKSGKPSKIYVVKNERFNHIDFFTAKDADSLVYKPIVNILNNISNNR